MRTVVRWSLHSLTVVRWSLHSLTVVRWSLHSLTVVRWSLHSLTVVRWVACSDDVEGDCGAEVDHNTRAAEESVGTSGIGETVGPDLFRMRIIYPYGKFAAVAEMVNRFWLQP